MSYKKLPRFRAFLVVGLSATSATLLLPRSVQAFTLGPAQGYNLFVLGDVAQDTIHSEGKVAVGGNITSLPMSNGSPGSYGIATKLSTGDNFIVGGNVNLGLNGQVNGRTIYGGIANVNSSQGAVVGQPIDFVAAGTNLRSLSSQWRGLTNGKVSSPASNGVIVLSGDQSNYNIFDLSSSQLTNTVRYQIQVPVASQIIINILGDEVNLANGNFTFEVSEDQRSRLLYNFDARRLTAQGVGFLGSVLAPDAAFMADNGQILGTGVFASLQQIPDVGGTFEYNWSQPTDESSGDAVPTPALLPGAIAIAWRTWRRRSRQA